MGAAKEEEKVHKKHPKQDNHRWQTLADNYPFCSYLGTFYVITYFYVIFGPRSQFSEESSNKCWSPDPDPNLDHTPSCVKKSIGEIVFQ